MVVVPADTPVTSPLPSTVATPVTVLLQLPLPPPTSLSDSVAVPQIADAPDKVPATGSAFTVIIFVAAAVPQLLFIV